MAWRRQARGAGEKRNAEQARGAGEKRNAEQARLGRKNWMNVVIMKRQRVGVEFQKGWEVRWPK